MFRAKNFAHLLANRFACSYAKPIFVGFVGEQVALIGIDVGDQYRQSIGQEPQLLHVLSGRGFGGFAADAFLFSLDSRPSFGIKQPRAFERLGAQLRDRIHPRLIVGGPGLRRAERQSNRADAAAFQHQRDRSQGLIVMGAVDAFVKVRVGRGDLGVVRQPYGTACHHSVADRQPAVERDAPPTVEIRLLVAVCAEQVEGGVIIGSDYHQCEVRMERIDAVLDKVCSDLIAVKRNPIEDVIDCSCTMR